jgi:phage host-nuclease inhibitor protein Gam
MMAVHQEGDLPTTSRHSVTAFSSIEAKLNDTKNYHSTSSSCTMANVRDEILHLGAIVGQLCTVFLSEQQTSSEQTKAAHFKLGQVFLRVFVVANVCGIDLPTSILKKVELNGRKYPVELCKVGLLTTMEGGNTLLVVSNS